MSNDQRPTPETDAAIIKADGSWTFDLKSKMQEMERERDEARDLARELRDALSTMLDEYEDRRCQFGTDYFWKKHEDTDAISNADKTLTKAKEMLS